MKQLIFILALIFTISCTKDQINTTPIVNLAPIIQQDGVVVLDNMINTGIRIGEGDLIFFRNSMTTDNYLVSNNNVGREHKAYNTPIVAYVQFNLGLATKLYITTSELAPNGAILYKQVIYKHYKTMVQFRDSTRFAPERLTTYSKDTVDHFRYYPTGGILKVANDNIISVAWRRDSTSILINNDFRLTRYQGWVWNIYRNGVFFEKKLKEPTNILSNQFQPNHRN